jgi:hypothetical protein
MKNKVRVSRPTVRCLKNRMLDVLRDDVLALE